MKERKEKKMAKQMIKKIRNKAVSLIEAHRAPILDLTNNDWKNDKKFNLVGLKILTKPYNRIALGVAIFTFILTSLFPGPNVLGFYLVKLILGKYG